MKTNSTGSPTYNVSSDGALTITRSTTENGVVKSDGEYLLIVDTDTNDNELSFEFGIKKQEGETKPFKQLWPLYQGPWPTA